MSGNIVYGAPVSPFVRKVLLTLEHYGQPYHCKAEVTPFNLTDEFIAISPLKKIPAFKDDLVQLADSSVICHYLDKRHQSPEYPSLYPAEATRFAQARWLEEYAGSKLLEVFGAKLFFERIIKPKLLNQPTNEALVSENLAQNIPPVLEYLEQNTPQSGYLVGEYSIADIAIGSQFLNASYAGFSVDPQQYPKLFAYLERLFARADFQAKQDNDRALFQ